MIVWQNGSLIPEEEFRLSPFDTGLTVGKGVFETLLALRGEPFAWTRHYRRLSEAAHLFSIEIPSSELLRDAVLAVLNANEFIVARVRVTITGGVGGPGVSRKGAPTAFVTTTPFVEFPEEAKVCLGGSRDFAGPLDAVKSLSYAENILLMEEAKRKGFDEILISNSAGNLIEGSGSNVFVVRQGVVLTPPLSDKCLPGVTRALVLNLLKKEKWEHREISIPTDDLSDADEIWLTSSTRRIQRVTGLAEKSYGAEAPFFKKMRARFDQLMLEQIDP